MRRQTGFTLLEILVAMTLLALFAVMSYRALDAVLEEERHALSTLTAWRGLSLAFARLQADLQDAVPATSMAARPAFSVETAAPGQLGFSFDRRLPDDARPGRQRVSYLYVSGQLYRAVHVSPASGDAAATVLMTGLKRLDLRFLDSSGQWRRDWPGQGGSLPTALELELAWPDGLELRRVFLLR